MTGTSHCFDNKVLIMCKISNSFHSYISVNSTHLFIDVHRTIPSLSFMSLITSVNDLISKYTFMRRIVKVREFL